MALDLKEKAPKEGLEGGSVQKDWQVSLNPHKPAEDFWTIMTTLGYNPFSLKQTRKVLWERTNGGIPDPLANGNRTAGRGERCVLGAHCRVLLLCPGPAFSTSHQTLPEEPSQSGARHPRACMVCLAWI